MANNQLLRLSDEQLRGRIAMLRDSDGLKDKEMLSRAGMELWRRKA